MKKHIVIYLKYNLKIAIIIGAIPLLLTVILLLVPNTKTEDALLFLIPSAFGLLYFLWSLLYLIGFRDMIRTQENRFGIVFEDKNAVKLDQIVFTSDHWLIFSGKYAFYASMIQNITSFQKRSTRGNAHYIVIHTVDGEKYKVYVVASLIPKIKTWFQKIRREENAEKRSDSPQ